MAKPEVIRPYLEKLMKELLGVESLIVWDDGTIPIRAGSAGVYVRLTEVNDRALVHVYSPLLRGVAQTPALLDRLNEINASSYQARVFWIEEQVIAAIDLLAEALDKEELKVALELISGFADLWDTELRAAFGGQTAFDDATPEPPEGAPTLPPPPGGATTDEHVVAAAGEDDDEPEARGGMQEGYL
jgi:type III secretion system-like peptide-binding chaperone